ncbi:hypothetical protein ACFXHA_30810 [Nocardia sp. NPDC059240]|uniref:hypothetical protein n=1 Tax=Nocardia sp. NPDC059240 TaxID=3346786 RepID=UPI003695D552
MLAVLLLNAAIAVVSGASCLVGLVRPRLALPAGELPSAGSMFFLGAYAARALPLSLVTLTVLAVGSTAAIVPLLVVSGAAQLWDAALGARQRNWPMAVTCVGLAAVHLATAAWLPFH